MDATRYFFLMRPGQSPFTFDVDLARKQTDENPIFYVQMAHARMSGIFRVGGPGAGVGRRATSALAALPAPEDLELLKKLAVFPDVVGQGGPSRASRTGSPTTSKISPGCPTAGTTSAGCWASRPPPRQPGSRWPAPPASSSPTASACSASPPPTGCDRMSLLVVGSVALDSIITPFGETADALGGSAVYFSVAASLLHRVRVVGVVGDDYPMARARAAGAARHRLVRASSRHQGESFRWKGKYSFDLPSRETLETRLGVFADFQPKLPAGFRETPFVLPRQHPSRAAARVLDQMQTPRLVACDTMNYWIESKPATALMEVLEAGGPPDRQRRGDPAALGRLEHPPRRPLGPGAGSQAGGRQAGRARRAAGGERPQLLLSRPIRWRRSSIRPARATASPAASWATSRAPATCPATGSAGRWSTARRWDRSRSPSFGIGGFEGVTPAIAAATGCAASRT